MDKFLFLLGLCAAFFLTACEAGGDTSGFRSSTLDADASIDELPASWEGDWTWEDPEIFFDQGILHEECPTDTSNSSHCVANESLGQTIRISVSSNLISHCPYGHVIHLWDADGIEHLSPPDRTLIVELSPNASGWIAFNVTCGSDWDNVMDWSTITATELIERGLIAVTTESNTITDLVTFCPSPTGISPRFPIECGIDPCS